MLRRRRPAGSLGSLRSGAFTAASLVVVAAGSAAIGIVIAREFGRGEDTDGLLAAYGVFIVLTIAAQSIRVAVLPQFALARADGRLAGEIAGAALALLVAAAPVIVIAELGAGVLAELLTGADSGLAHATAENALRWMVPAACAYLVAAIAASALAALDDYGTAALGFAVGSLAGLALILLRAGEDGIEAISWGISLNASVALLVPVSALAVKALRERVPARAARPTGSALAARLGGFAVAASLPLALQLLYVVCLPFAARLGEGEATSFVYAYLAASALVAVTASSLGLVTSVPLARIGLDPAGVARHVVAASWLALVFVGLACAVVAVVGADLFEAVLGSVYGDEVGEELSRLVVFLGPWMIVAVGFTVTFPLVFVAGRTSRLPWIGVAALALQLPLAWAGAETLGLVGLALALATTTALVLAALLAGLGALRPAARGLVVAALLVTLSTAGALGVSRIASSTALELALVIAVYLLALLLLCRRPLLESWTYVRALG